MVPGERIDTAALRAEPAAMITRRQALIGGLTTMVGGVGLATLGLGATGGIGPASATAAETATVSVEPDSVIGALPARSMGLSFERKTLGSALFSADNEALVALFQLLGPGVLRIGGNSVETTSWDPDGAGFTVGTVAPPDVARLAAFAEAVDWQIIYGTPFIAADAADIASEIAVVASALGSRLDAVELGNEPDLYVLTPAASALAGSFPAFRARWESFAAAVVDAAPGVALAGPATCLLQSIGGWTTPFAADESPLAVLTQHYYRGFGTMGSISELLAPDPLLASSLTALATASTAAGTNFRLGETNSYANGGQPGVSNTLASALWGTRLVLSAAGAGAAGVNFHNSGAGAGYPALVQVNGVITEIRPLFYGLLLAARIGSGQLVRTTIQGAPETLGAWAVRRTPERFGVALVNVDPDGALDVTIDFGTRVGAALLTTLDGASLDATTGTTLAGAAVGIDGSWTPELAAPTSISGSSVQIQIAPASAVLVDVSLAADTSPTSPTGPSVTASGSTTAPAATPVDAEPDLTG